MPTILELAIYRTLAYFAYFKYPLSSFEIWKWLLEPGQAVSLAAVVEALEHSDWLKSQMHEARGFYALGDVKIWHQERHVRFLDAMRKFRKAELAVQLLGRLPWIDGIAVCNSLSWYQTRPDSDIDLFIVARAGRIWSARLLSTIPAMLLRQRPGEGKADPVCLSFFCTDTAFNFEKLKVQAADPYLAYWSRALVPLVDHTGWLDKFEMSNPWLRQVLPNAQFVRRASRFRPSLLARLPWLPFSDKLAKQMQLDRFPAVIRELMNKDTRVVVGDDMLKFHEQDSREQILAALADKLAAV